MGRLKLLRAGEGEVWIGGSTREGGLQALGFGSCCHRETVHMALLGVGQSTAALYSLRGRFNEVSTPPIGLERWMPIGSVWL